MVLHAEEPSKTLGWVNLKITRSQFSPEMGMMNTEREDYATNLAVLAGNRIAEAKASTASLHSARKMLAVALQLSPRNRRAVVLNFQLGRGLVPEVAEASYSPPVFARLVMTRGQLLTSQGGAENELLARCFTELAAELDPKNEEAVYASEIQRLDHGEVEWRKLEEDPG